MDQADIVIVGGGLAGATTAESYRKAGGTGSILLISQDTDLPVHRPPLSKGFLKGEEDREKVFVHPASFYAGHKITVSLRTTVENIDLEGTQIQLADGRRCGFGTLVLATGARPRHLTVPGAELPGVFYLRSLSSSEKLRAAYQGASHAVIIGAGFIGMEVAASLTQVGLTCTVVEMAPRMWSRLVPEETAGFIQQYFEKRGVTFRFGVSVSALEGDDRVRSVVLDTGETLRADLVVAGVGVGLNTGAAETAGLDVDRGIVVDEYFRTSHPSVYAIGDIASFPDPVGGRIHLEHWDNALNQGRSLGQTLAGQPMPFDHLAYFFSDMFDLSLNMVGYPMDWDDIIVRGLPESSRFTTIYVKNSVVRAALMVNDDQYFDAWTQLVKTRQPTAGLADVLSDPSIVPLNRVVAGTR